jgi:RNA polymerase sigma-70 factor, ECF subfamily
MGARVRKDQRTDIELIDAINRGDADAFDALYFRYRDWVASLAVRFTRNHADALDVLQETFSYLLKKFPGFKLTSAMKTFLYPVVKNNSLTLLRKRGREVSNEQAIDATPATDQPVGHNPREDLAAVVAILPEAQREVLLMRFVDDMTLQEIADALNAPLGTAKSRLHHGLKTLREDEGTRGYFEG